MHLALKQALLEWKSKTEERTWGFRFPSCRHKGQRALDLGAVLKRKIRPAFVKAGISRVGWHTFRHTVGTMLAEMGEHQLTIRDYLRHSNLQRHEQVLAGGVESKRLTKRKLVMRSYQGELLSASKSTLTQ